MAKKKRNHKSSMRIKKKKPKARKTWEFNPVTRVEADEKKYNRNKSKKKFQKEKDSYEHED